jgi:hypothetical protein
MIRFYILFAIAVFGFLSCAEEKHKEEPENQLDKGSSHSESSQKQPTAFSMEAYPPFVDCNDDLALTNLNMIYHRNRTALIKHYQSLEYANKKELHSKIPELVNQLGSPVSSVRVEAFSTLKKLGPRVLGNSYFLNALKDKDPEILRKTNELAEYFFEPIKYDKLPPSYGFSEIFKANYEKVFSERV